MLKNIIDILNAALLATNYFEQLFCLAELIKQGDGARPMVYASKGEYTQVNDFDNYNGMGYWRKNGEVNISEADNASSMVSCATLLLMEFPLKFVCCIPKENLALDDQYTDDDVANAMISVISGNNNLIKTAVKAQLVKVLPQKYNSNNQDVLAGEYPGIEIPDINYKFAYLSIDFNVQVTINKNCIPNPCS